MPFDSLVRTKQVNKPEFSGYIVDVLLQYLKTGSVTGIAMNTGQLSGRFYPLDTNPSGYLTTGTMSGYATQDFVLAQDAAQLSYIDATYYPNANPSGFVTSGELTGMGTSTGDFTLVGINGITISGNTGTNTIYIGSSGIEAILTGFVQWKYFDTGQGQTLPYIFMWDPALNGAWLFNGGTSENIMVGARVGYPSENYFIDFYGTSAANFGLTYNRPTIVGFDVSGNDLYSNGYHVLTTKDMTGIATLNQLLTCSGLLEDEIWTYRSELIDMITGSSSSTHISVTGKVLSGVIPFSGLGGMQVTLGPDNSILFIGGGAGAGGGVSTITVIGSSPISGNVSISGSGQGVIAYTQGQNIILGGNFVTITGAQTISGNKIFSGTVTAHAIRAPAGKNSVDLDLRQLIVSDTISLDWQKCWLGDVAHYINPILDWSGQKTYDTSSKYSMDWNNRLLFDGTNPSLYWGNRTLNDNGGVAVLYWGSSYRLTGAWAAQSLTISGFPVMVSSGQTFGGGGGGGGVSGIVATGVYLSGWVMLTGASGIRVMATGGSGFAIAADWSILATDTYVDGVSGNLITTGTILESKFAIVSGTTGSFITTGMTGQFASEFLGLPTDGAYGGSQGAIAGVSQGDTHEDAFDKVEVVLGKLAPAKPLSLSQATFALTGTTYTAYMQGTNTSYSNMQPTQKPTGFATGFYDGDAGILSGFINGNASGSRTLTTGVDTGNFSGLRIYADWDFWTGVQGKAGFWSSLSACVTPSGIGNASVVNTGLFTLQMRHSTAGNTQLLTGYSDIPTPTASLSANGFLTGTGTVSLRWVDGVPSFAAGDVLRLSCTGNGLVTAFYNSNFGQFSAAGGQFGTTTVAATGTPVSGQPLQVSGNPTVANGVYGTGFAITATLYNSVGSSVGISFTPTPPFRVDTNSNQQAQRQTAGTGQWPVTGFGSGYDNGASFQGNEELQMINSSIQYPPRYNYSQQTPVGPNYNNLPSGTYSSGYRWACFNFGNITNISNITLTFNGTANFGASTIVPGFALYVRVPGATNGWIDGNAAYPGVGNPTNNGDAALVVGSSNATFKYITFGTAALTGPVYIRVGLPSGSTKTFTTVSFATA